MVIWVFSFLDAIFCAPCSLGVGSTSTLVLLWCLIVVWVFEAGFPSTSPSRQDGRVDFVVLINLSPCIHIHLISLEVDFILSGLVIVDPCLIFLFWVFISFCETSSQRFGVALHMPVVVFCVIISLWLVFPLSGLSHFTPPISQDC